jgi:hypothetical protein
VVEWVVSVVSTVVGLAQMANVREDCIMAEQTQTRWDWLPDVATVGSILACYGTLAILGLLSLMGVSIALHEGAWAGVISAFCDPRCLWHHPALPTL